MRTTRSIKEKGSNSRSSKEKSNRGHHSKTSRLEALRQYYVGGYSVKALATQYQLTTVTIRNWISTFERKYPEVSIAMKKKQSTPTTGSTERSYSAQDYQALKAKLIEQEKELHATRLERDTYKTCLEVYTQEEQKKRLDPRRHADERPL